MVMSGSPMVTKVAAFLSFLVRPACKRSSCMRTLSTLKAPARWFCTEFSTSDSKAKPRISSHCASPRARQALTASFTAALLTGANCGPRWM